VSGALQLDEAHRVLAAACAATRSARWSPPPGSRTDDCCRRQSRRLRSFLAAALATGRPAHITFSALALASSLVVLVGCFRGEPVARASWRDYVTLTKPRIMTLLLLTGGAGMVIGAQGWPGTWLFVVTLAGLALACGGASALNHVLDSDVDRLMSRTGGRPVATDRISPGASTRVRAHPLGLLVRPARLARERADGRSSRSSGTSSTCWSTRAG
jgi:hypothetical protein